MQRPAPSTTTPSEVFRAIGAEPRIAFLDGRAALERAPWSLIARRPQRELRIDADRFADVARAGDPLATIDDFLARESAASRTVVGVLAYELGGAIEPRAATRRRSGALPLAVFTSYAEVHRFDHRVGRWSGTPPRFDPRPPQRCRVGGVRVAVGEAEYRRLFDRAHAWIGAGDVYQVNLSIAFEAGIDGEAATFYERLAAASPSPYGAFLDCGDFQLLSNSPELFLARRGKRIVTRPIKGTRPRAAAPAEDANLRRELRQSAKDRAEHVMIVDLERNDLGRLGRVGSVRVDELAALQSYATVHHMESTISAEVPPDVPLSAILRATFPGGSITGAPKIRAMQIIGELEAEERGFYTGAVLHHPPDGDFTMSLAIRTATVVGDRIRYDAGGGLVWDSRAEDEYRECLTKARAFLDAAAR